MAEPRTLFVVADDGGVDAARDRGIVEALDAGVVRNVSVFAGMPDVEPFAAALRGRPGVSVLLHLNLTEGAALAGPAATLTGPDGKFPGDRQAVWRRAHEGGIDPAEVAREVAAQLARLRALGLEPVGVNGHNHVHVLPGVRDGLLAVLAREPAVRWIRIPAEPEPPEGVPAVREPAVPFVERDLDVPARRMIARGHLALASLRVLAAQTVHRLPGRLRFSNEFLGFAFATTGSLMLVATQLRETKGRTVEMMIHPGRASAEGVAFSRDPVREQEREVACSPAFRQAIEEAGFRPASIAEAIR
jgi:predicted glycoside hydrolase/deacetylase ChbG (UPF0249 family)